MKTNRIIKNNADFVHLHNHTEYSRFDGLNKVSEWVLHARKSGFQSIAITDHGNVGGLIKFYQECKRKKDKKDNEIPYPALKPIFGQEFYLSRDHKARGEKEQKDGRKGNRHILLLAKNEKGYANLCKLSQIGFIEGQAFGDPRIDLELLSNHSEGLIASSACLSSVINNNILNGRYDYAKKSVKIFKDIFKEDFFLEVMYHGIEEEKVIIPDIIRLGQETDTKIILTNDCHYLCKGHAKSQEVLMCMSTSKCIKDPKRYSFPYQEFYLKSAEEMSRMFIGNPEFLLNTVEVAERIEDFLKPGGMRLPAFDVEFAKMENNAQVNKDLDFYSRDDTLKIKEEKAIILESKTAEENFNESFEFMKDLAYKGMKKCGWDKSQKHIDRLEMELNDVKIAWTSNKMNFPTYFLTVWRYINYAKNNNIMVGFGRGSGFGSLLLRVLEITTGVDPIEKNLLWERFLSFDSAYFINDQDLGIGEDEVKVDIDSLISDNSDELDEEREVELDEGGVDRY